MHKKKCCLVLVIFIILYSCWLYHDSAKVQESELLARIEALETKCIVLQEELLLKTHPAYVDMSLRAHFDKLLKEDPDQVRGIDGLLPNER